jgi:diguanylate cyclase (GGDEF)-like protein
MGLASTVLPLWGGEGAGLSLVQLWPVAPMEPPVEVPLGMALVLVGGVLAVVLAVSFVAYRSHWRASTSSEIQVLYEEARNDALTGLGNSRAFREELERRSEEFKKRGETFSLVLMDLDGLKRVNDRDGHAAGDEMLISMARTMRDLARANDRLFRIGGDEFALILPDTDLEDAAGVAERILHFCKRPSTGVHPSPFSCGISGVPWFARDEDLVYKQADAALYWVKRHGKSSCEIFEPERDDLPYEQPDGEEVARIVAGRLFSPVFQPIVDLRTGKVLGFEGLIRPDPDSPLSSAGLLFKAAAACGRTVELDLACAEAVIGGARGIGPDRLLTMNLSPRTLELNDFDVAWLLSGLVRNGISPSRVIVELTERDEVDDIGRLHQAIGLLQQYGVRVAADDVGAGNSGLRLLSQVQFDIVKIDLALVQDGVRRAGARAVLQTIRDLALNQNARIVAEGVETGRQLQVLRDLHIGAAQGFLLGRPDASLERTFVDLRRIERALLLQGEPLQPASSGVHANTSPGLGESVGRERTAVLVSPSGEALEPSPVA